jgi:hypothetical protein
LTALAGAAFSGFDGSSERIIDKTFIVYFAHDISFKVSLLCWHFLEQIRNLSLDVWQTHK